MTASFRTIGFPDHLFKITSGSFDLEVRHAFSDTIFNTFVRAAGPVLFLWACKLNLAAMSREGDEDRERGGWQEWQAFKARLSGQVTLFTLRAPGRNLPLGVGAGYATDSAAYSITGTTITGTTIRQGAVTGSVHAAAARYAESILINFGADQAGEVVLKHGDLFGLGGNLYMSTAKVTANASGIARVPFRAPLWKGAKVGDLVNFDRPTCRVQLRAPSDGAVELSLPLIGSTGFSAVEVPYT